MECYLAIKRIALDSVLMSWMNLEPIIQSKVSQKEKNKYRIYMESRKRVRMNLFVGQQWKHGQRGQTCGHGEWNKWREQRGHMYISVCKTDSQGDLLYDSGGHTSAVTT